MGEYHKSIAGKIQNGILDWFASNGRSLPWRKNYSAYEVWISEIMLQQTQMERGVDYFLKWMKRFPTVTDVAEAEEQEILKYWEGLGYYARARNLQKAAGIMVKDHGAAVPTSYEELLCLPGIGEYTASAVASIAYKLDYPVVDANVERVYARIFDISSPLKEKETRKNIKSMAKDLLPAGQARNYNQGLMDFGAMVCSPKNPDCEKCFLNEYCLALQNGCVELRPVVAKKEKQITIHMVSGILVHNDRIFIQQRLEKDVWGGLWEFPGGEIEKGELAEAALKREFSEETEFEVEVGEYMLTVNHFYTKYKVILHCYRCFFSEESANLPQPVLHAAQQFRWVEAEELNEFGFSSGHRKIINTLFKSDPDYFLTV